jgi:adenine/guanine phosphoribosyltransferase-like PRPP-binding protein
MKAYMKRKERALFLFLIGLFLLLIVAEYRGYDFRTVIGMVAAGLMVGIVLAMLEQREKGKYK